jgi:hypothetical protein
LFIISVTEINVFTMLMGSSVFFFGFGLIYTILSKK